MDTPDREGRQTKLQKSPRLESPELLTGIKHSNTSVIRLWDALIGSKTKAVNQQIDSPLFRLPPEIRDCIWEYALAPHQYAKPGHFHIYDEVYDFCTYEMHVAQSELPQRPLHRQRGRQVALVLTCRAVYEESQHFLYDCSTFTLVILPGIARPVDNIRRIGLASLGKLHQCQELFRCMRNVTIVVQPGRKPNTKKYVARISKLLEVLDYGRHIRSLRLQFNFHAMMHKYDSDYERRNAIIQSFYPLEDTVMSKRLKLAIDASSLDRVSWHHKFSELWTVLGEAEIRPWHALYPGQHTREDHRQNRPCLQSGVIGQDGFRYIQPSPKEKRKEDAKLTLALAVFFLTLPVSLPLHLGAYAARKKIKGEW